MNLFLAGAKVFAVLILFFANFLLVNAQNDSIYRIPAGTRIRLKMDTEIGSKVSSVNDTFTATISEPLSIRELVVLPAGTVIEGRVVKVTSASIGGKDGYMEVRFETIRLEKNQKREIDGFLVKKLVAGSSRTVNFLSVLGGTAIGTIFGAVSKVDNGALIGAGIGAGAGTGVALLRKGRNVRIKTDEAFEIELKKDVTLPVRDY